MVQPPDRGRNHACAGDCGGCGRAVRLVAVTMMLSAVKHRISGQFCNTYEM